MDSDGSTTASPNKIKQESPSLKPIGSGGKTKKTLDGQKKRSLVRWNDDVDKQVLLTLQWACNEVGIKPPWDLVAQTMGGGITSGAIIQHLAKLRGKMLKAEISVPPKLSRGTVAKEPSKVYATNNGKKLPPPAFRAPSTPVQGTPKSKPKSKVKGKRVRADLDDSDDEINEYVDDSDEDYGVTKKKARTSRAKPKSSASKSSNEKSKVNRVDVAAANEINDDILRTLEDEDEDGGPASRTRHIKQNFTDMDEAYTDLEEEAEEAVHVANKFEMPQMHSPTSIKEEDSASPCTMIPRTNLKVVQWSKEVTSSMKPPNFHFPVTADHGVGAGAYRQTISSNGMGLHTPQPSRSGSMTTLTSSLHSTAAPTNFLSTPEQNMGYGGLLTNSGVIQDLIAPVHFHGFDNQMITLNQGVDDLGSNIGDDLFYINTPFPSADLNPSPEDSDDFNSTFLDSFNWGHS